MLDEIKSGRLAFVIFSGEFTQVSRHIYACSSQRTGLRCLQFIGGRKPFFESHKPNSAREKEIDQKKVGKFVKYFPSF